jgi:hypothetical protein
VAVATNLINSILDSSSLSSDMSMVLANAIYFNGKWDKPFTDLRTMVAKFYLLGGAPLKPGSCTPGRANSLSFMTDARCSSSQTNQGCLDHHKAEWEISCGRRTGIN